MVRRKQSKASLTRRSGSVSTKTSKTRTSSAGTSTTHYRPSIVQRSPIRRYRSGHKALRDIRQLQRTTQLIIPRAPFARLVREIANQCTTSEPMFIRTLALEALQEACEMYIVQFLEDSYLCSLHARRVTLQDKDMHLARRIRGRSDVIN